MTVVELEVDERTETGELVSKLQGMLAWRKLLVRVETQLHALEKYNPYSFTGHFFLIGPPHFINANGTGVTRRASMPSSVLPIPSPSESYTAGPTSGRKAPNIERVTTSAATADAAVSRKASTAYVWQGTNMPSIANPKGINDRQGTIQWMEDRAVQAYMKSEMGMKGAK